MFEDCDGFYWTKQREWSVRVRRDRTADMVAPTLGGHWVLNPVMSTRPSRGRSGATDLGHGVIGQNDLIFSTQLPYRYQKIGIESFNTHISSISPYLQYPISYGL